MDKPVWLKMSCFLILKKQKFPKIFLKLIKADILETDKNKSMKYSYLVQIFFCLTSSQVFRNF